MKRSKMYLLGTIILMILVGLVVISKDQFFEKSVEKTELKKIDVQLKWVHQSQFAGMYVAQEKGFYAKEGLDVNLIPFSFDIDKEQAVLDGEVDFAVTGGSDLIQEVAEGNPLKSIAVIYKKTPYTLYSLVKDNIKTPKDFIGKTIGMQPTTDGQALLSVMLKSLSITEDQLTIVDTGYNADDLLNGVVDISSGYIINEPNQAIEAGFEVNTFLMADYGANLYGDIIIASEEMIEKDPELVRAFIKATLAGWEYAIENPDEAVTIVLKYAEDRTMVHESYMMRQSIPLVHTGSSPIGMMSAEEWTRNVELLFGQGAIQKKVDSSELFTNEFIE